MHRVILGFQGGYYLLTGIWPLISISTFERVTGQKADDWLVQTVGVLAGAIGIVLLSGLRRATPVFEVRLLFVLAAIGFLSVDVVFWARGIISKIYLLDAAEQAVALMLFLLTVRRYDLRHGH